MEEAGAKGACKTMKKELKLINLRKTILQGGDSLVIFDVI